jgi:hypothetical protein
VQGVPHRLDFSSVFYDLSCVFTRAAVIFAFCWTSSCQKHGLWDVHIGFRRFSVCAH